MTSTFEERKNQVKKIKDSFQQLTKGTDLRNSSSSSSSSTATNSWYYDHLNMSTTATRRLNRSTSGNASTPSGGLPPRSPSVGSSGSSSSKRLASSYHVVPMTMEEEETNTAAHYNNRLPQPKVFQKKNDDNYEYDVDDVVQDLIHDMEEGAGSVSGVNKRGGVLDDDSLMNETDFASTHTSGGGHHSSYHTSTSSYVNESDDDDDDDDVIQNNHHQGNHNGTFYTEEKIDDDVHQNQQGDVASEYGEHYHNEGDEDDDGLFARSTDPDDIRRAAIAMINAEEGGTGTAGTVNASSSPHIYSNNNGDTGGVLSDHEYEMLAEVTSRRGEGPKKHKKKKKMFQRVEKGYHYHALDGNGNTGNSGGCVQQVRDFVVHVIMFRDGKSCATILFLIGFFVMMATIMIDVAVKNANEILSSTSTEQVPPPSANLQRFCGKHYYDELGNGLDDCREVCAPGACCNSVDQSENCFASNMEHCSTYTVCLVLDRIDENSAASQGKPLNDIMTDMTMMPMGAMHVVSQPPPDIKQVCNEDQMNSIKEGGSCQVMCEEAKCCFDADTVNNCYSFSEDNQETCEVYRTHCMYLGEPYGGYPTKLVDPPSNLEELCSSDYIESNGVLMCQMACEHGDCCFNEQYPNSHGPCYDLLQESCQKYESCRILLQQPRQKDVTAYGYNDNDDDEEDNDMNIYYNDETTADEQEQTNLGEEEEQDEYEGSTVTVSTHMDNGEEEDATPDYYNDENENDMNIYYSENEQDKTIADEPTANDDGEYYDDEEESNRNSVMVVVPKPISTLNRICNSLLINDEENDLGEQCREECSKARCCVSGLENDPDFDCFDEYNERHCLMYLPCYTVNPDFAQLMDHPLLEEVIVRPVALVQDSWSLEDTCTKASDENDETAQRLCQETCAGAQCCVSETPEMNCFENYKEQCLAYQSCVHVYPNEFSFMTTTADTDTNDNEQLQQHEPLPMPSVDLEDVCSFDSLNNNSSKKKQCMEECSEAHCCFRDDPFFNVDENYYCGESNYDECLVYQPCERLWQDLSDSMVSSEQQQHDGHDHSSKVPLPPSQLDQICDTTLIANDSDMMQECMEYCLKAECCFMEDDDPDSCIDYVDECYDYQPCENLHEWYLGGQESAQEIEIEDEYTETPAEEEDDEEETTASSVMVSTSISNEHDADEPYYDAGVVVVVVEEPTKDVNAICSKVAYGDMNSIDECTNICTPASDCCVSSEQNCFKNNAETCVKYLACVAIDERYATMLMTKEEEFQSIEDAQQKEEEEEDDYEMNIYYEDEDEQQQQPFVLPPPSDQLEFVCSDKSLEVSDAACQVFCKISECCFHQQEEESCADDDECINYQICSKMFPIRNSRDVRGNEYK